jgi:hypothetical protein
MDPFESDDTDGVCDVHWTVSRSNVSHISKSNFVDVHGLFIFIFLLLLVLLFLVLLFLFLRLVIVLRNEHTHFYILIVSLSLPFFPR